MSESAHGVEVWLTVGIDPTPVRVGRSDATEEVLRNMVATLEEAMARPKVMRVWSGRGWLIFPSTQLVDMTVVGVDDVGRWLGGARSSAR